MKESTAETKLDANAGPDQILERLKRIVDEQVAPRAAHHDVTGAFPAENMRAIAQAGLYGLLIPTRYGGLGSDHRTFSKAAESIARGCGSTAMVFVMHNVYVVPVVDYGSDRLKEFMLPGIARGEQLVTGATTEPQGGGGAHSVFALERAGDELVITADKPCVTSANHADWIAVLIRPDAETPSHIKTLVMAPGTKSPQVKGVGTWDTIGMRATSSSGLKFDNCRVPSWFELKGWQSASYSSGLPTLILGYSSVWLGLAERAYELAINHVTRRTHEQIVADRRQAHAEPAALTVKNTVASYESVQRQVSEMRSFIDATRTLVADLAAFIDRHRPEGGGPLPEKIVPEVRLRCASARLMSGEGAIETCRTAMRICGLRALQRDFPLERCLRDAITSQPMAPAEDACKVDHGKRLLGLL